MGDLAGTRRLHDHPFRPPHLIRIEASRVGSSVISAHPLEDGALVPRVVVPLIRRREGWKVILGVGEREEAYIPPRPGGSPEWEDGKVELLAGASPTVTVNQMAPVPSISFPDEAYRCDVCLSEIGWSIEWVSGAIYHTSAVECRCCWHRDTRPWTIDLVRRLIPVNVDEVDGDRLDL